MINAKTQGCNLNKTTLLLLSGISKIAQSQYWRGWTHWRFPCENSGRDIWLAHVWRVLGRTDNRRRHPRYRCKWTESINGQSNDRRNTDLPYRRGRKGFHRREINAKFGDKGNYHSGQYNTEVPTTVAIFGIMRSLLRHPLGGRRLAEIWASALLAFSLILRGGEIGDLKRNDLGINSDDQCKYVAVSIRNPKTDIRANGVYRSFYATSGGVRIYRAMMFSTQIRNLEGVDKVAKLFLGTCYNA